MKTCDCNIVTKYYLPSKISDVHRTCTTVVRAVCLIVSFSCVAIQAKIYNYNELRVLKNIIIIN